MTASKFSAAAGALLLIAGSARAITVSGLNLNSTLYSTTSGEFSSSYTGVAELQIVRSDLGFGVIEGCSGALLADGVSIVTSAHCVADANGTEEATAAYITFTTQDGTFISQAVSFKVDPLYNGSPSSPYDVAIVTLASAAPDSVARYGLYTGDASDQVITLAGYGFGGTGARGYDPMDFPSGILRTGDNQYLSDAGNDDLMYDFTDPSSATGLDYNVLDEGFMAPGGDAGGPSFIDGEIAGIHSYVTFADGSTISGNSVPNSSFGEVAADASVAFNLGFIQAAMVQSPEPRLMIVLGIALVAVALAGDGRKHH